MRVPPGVHAWDADGNQLVCKLKRSLYGLKQAGREWATLFASFLVSWGFTRSSIDVCLFIYSCADGILWCLVYVDDCCICDSNSSLRERFVADLGKRFPVDDREELSWMLGVAIARNRASRTLSLSQSLYVKDLLDRYGSHLDGISRTVDMPAIENLVLSSADMPADGSADASIMAPRREAYMSMVGAFLWLSNMTRPEVAHIVSQLARFISNPGTPHWNAAVRVLNYFRCTPNQCLLFCPNSESKFHVFVDSSWASKFSCSGALFFMFGCPFHWFAKTQRSVTLSSAEAEFFGAMMAARDLLWVRDLLVDLGFVFDGPTIVYIDSKSAVDMSVDPVAFKNTKHILRAAEFLRDIVLREVAYLKHLPGRYMLADLLTKNVSRQVFRTLMDLLAAYSRDGVAFHDPA